MSRCTPAVDAGVRSDGCRQTLMTQELPDNFKAARLEIKHRFRAQMSKFVRTDRDASPLAQIGPDQPGDRPLRDMPAASVDVREARHRFVRWNLDWAMRCGALVINSIGVFEYAFPERS
jgi:hypothetical protein